MVLSEESEALIESGELVLGDERDADTEALLMAAGGVQTNDGDTVIEELLHKACARDAGIAHGEVETVGHGVAHIVGIDKVETMAEENLLDGSGTATVFMGGFEEIILAVGCCAKHGSEGVLRRMGGATG